MKKRLYFFLMAVLSSFVAYSASVTVNVTTEGTLEQVLSEQSVTNITELTITGRLTAADLVYLRTGERVANVEVLDLSEVTLVPSDEPYNTLSGSGALGSTTYYFYIGADSTKLNSSTDGLGQPVKKYHYYSMNLGAAFVNTLYEKVVLPSSVTELGMYSFYGCKLLQTLEVPGGLEAVGRYAFYEDISLTTIDLSAITWAGECAFYGCTSLASVDLSSLDDMGEKAFYGCNALSGTLHLPKLKHVAKYGFAECTKVTGFEASELLKTIDDYAFSECSSIAELSLPEGLEEMGNYAFQNTKVTAVSFPKSMRIIGGHNFDGCKIESVAFSEGLESIGGGAFYGQPIKHITFPASLKYIGSEAFRYTNLESVTFTKGNGGLVIDVSAFFGLRRAEPDFVVNFAEGLESIGSCAFQECGLTSIDLPEGLKSIGYGAFRVCPFLNEVHLPSTLKEVGDDAFSSTPWVRNQTADDDGILYYGTVAVHYRGDLTEETVIKPKEGTLGIADCFAYNRPSVKNIVFPSTLKAIGSQAFFRTGISSIEFPDSLEKIGSEAFSDTPLTKVTIPENVNNIGTDPFSGCESLVQVTYNARNLSSGNLGTIPALSKLVIGSEVPVLPKQLVNTESSLRVTFEDRPEDSELFIGIAALPYHRMTALPLPNCRIALDDNAFACNWDGYYFRNRATFAFEISGVITALGKSALRETGVSGTVRLSDDVTAIPDYSFYKCSGMTAISISGPVTSIGEEAFSGCTGLTAIGIPDSVTSIGASAFSGCTGLTAINIPDSVTSIEEKTFLNCSGLTVANIGNSVTSIGASAFSGCKGLTAISFGNSVTSIGETAFRGCSKLTSVSIPNSVTTIDSYAFQECRGLKFVYITDIESWCGIEFGNESSNPLCAYSSSFTTRHLFVNDEEVFDLIIPEGVTSIGKYAFSSSLLTSVSIPSTVTSIGVKAFGGCEHLKEVRSDIIVPFAISNNVFSTYNIPLYVPAGTKAKYEVTDGWKNFSPNIIEMEEETVPVGTALVAGYSSDKALDFTGSDVTAWIATGFREGKILLSKVDVVPANTGIYVKSTKAGDFDVPVTTEKAYYVNMFQPVVTAKTVQPTETVDGVTYQTLSFALSQTTGQPAFFPNTAEKTYGDNKMYLRLPEWVLDGAARLMDNGEWIMDKRGEVTDVSTGDTEPVTIGTLGVAGFSSNRNLDFTNSDVEAWIATGFKGGNVMLSRVYAVPAGTGVYVKSKKTLTQQTTFQIPVTTELPYYVNAFVGLPDGGTVHPTETVSGVTMQTLSFATSKTTGKPAFFPNTADKTYGAGKMYLRLPADLVNSSDAARGLNFVFEGDEVAVMGETTGISEAEPFENEKTMVSTNRLRNGENEKRGGVYDLQGRRMETSNFKVQSSKLKKGMYIVNGKKVVVK